MNRRELFKNGILGGVAVALGLKQKECILPIPRDDELPKIKDSELSAEFPRTDGTTVVVNDVKYFPLGTKVDEERIIAILRRNTRKQGWTPL